MALRRWDARTLSRWKIAKANVHEDASQEEMEDGQQFHGGVGHIGEEEEKEEVDRIEEARLVVGGEGSAAVEIGIPQGDDTPPEIAGREAVEGIEKGDQVAAPGGHPGIVGEEELPEEAQGGKSDDAQS